MTDKTIYEQPLNEKIRAYLRLVHLFHTADHYLNKETEWDSRKTLTTLLSITDLISRIDIKIELIKDLERYTDTLHKLEQNPGVDHGKLKAFLGEVSKLLGQLKDDRCQPGQCLRDDDLAQSFKKRNNIPGDVCDFDLPRFHFWLNQPATTRRENLQGWYADLKIIKQSAQLFLLILRNNVNSDLKKADTGSYQELIDAELSCQMIRIILNKKSNYYPEVSSGKHRFFIRFMEQSGTNCRPKQTNDTVEFELHRCFL